MANLYDAVAVNYVHHLTQALLAKELYRRDKDYLVADGEVKIVDEFTGRTLDGRRWSDGLHQAVEAKERVRIKEENHTWATVTLQNYFRLYEKLAGHDRHGRDRGVGVRQHLRAPGRPDPAQQAAGPRGPARPHLQVRGRQVQRRRRRHRERHDRGQPVLVGTASVAKSEELSRLLDKRGIPHEVLNAKQHSREAEIVAQAGPPARGHRRHQHGRPRRRHHPRRQPRGPGPGRGPRPRASTSTGEGQAELPSLLGKFKAECAAEGDQVRELGGLYVLGSERHESRRIDNQLRGRSGRQGDPGESRFFLSLEDDLMRLFATGAMNWVMGRALPDDVPIEAKMVTKAIERAQNTVEGRNAESRKDVLKYDDVMNEQRKVIYAGAPDHRGRGPPADTDELLSATLDRRRGVLCPSDYPEEWDLDDLLIEVTPVLPDQVHASRT